MLSSMFRVSGGGSSPPSLSSPAGVQGDGRLPPLLPPAAHLLLLLFSSAVLLLFIRSGGLRGRSWRAPLGGWKHQQWEQVQVLHRWWINCRCPAFYCKNCTSFFLSETWLLTSTVRKNRWIWKNNISRCLRIIPMFNTSVNLLVFKQSCYSFHMK